MGGIVGAVIGSGSQKKAAKIQAKATIDAQNKNMAFATDMYGKNTAMFQPQTTYGDSADKMIAGLLGTGGDANASTAAFDAFKNSTGFKTNLQTGLDSVVANNATRGTLQSGAALKALQATGTNLNNGFLQQFIGNLTSQSNTGTAAKGAIAGQGVNLVNNITNGNNAIGTAIGDKAVAQSNILNNLLKGVGNSLTSSFTGGF